VADLNTDIPFKFMRESICIYIKSPDNIQYAEIEIDTKDEEYDIKFDNNKDYKWVILDIGTTIKKINTHVKKDEKIVLRIDTISEHRAEFHMRNGVIIWASEIRNDAKILEMEKLHELVKSTMENIEPAYFTIEPSVFAKICACGMSSDLERDIDDRVFFTLNNEGLAVTTGDRLKGTLFKLSREIKIDDVLLDQLKEKIINFKKTPATIVQTVKARGIDMFYEFHLPNGCEQTTYLTLKYLRSFLKLKDLMPIRIELRGEKPIVIKFDDINDINVLPKALLTVAPRTEEKLEGAETVIKKEKLESAKTVIKEAVEEHILELIEIG
jgi:hypothetical protein